MVRYSDRPVCLQVLESSATRLKLELLESWAEADVAFRAKFSLFESLCLVFFVSDVLTGTHLKIFIDESPIFTHFFSLKTHAIYTHTSYEQGQM